MAEAHAAVAFSFNVTPEGVDVKLNHEALKAVWHSGVHSWFLRFVRFKNHCINTLYPAPPISLFLVVAVVMGAQLYSGKDLSCGLIDWVASFFPICVHEQCEFAAAFFFGLAFWVAYVIIWRYSLKLLLMNHTWMYEPRGKMSFPNKIWVVLVKLLKGKNPLLYSYQAALPKLPVPSLQGTHDRYLSSVHPWMESSEYERMRTLADEFFSGVGRKLQRYLVLKSWWATNYVTDWWEEYVYLRGRSPIMVNSNYYGLDAILVHPTTIQAARAANMVHAFLKFKEMILHETLQPIEVLKTVPLCSRQNDHIFNTTRVPGVDTDTLVQSSNINYIVVLHKGRYFKVYTHNRGILLSPKDIEAALQQIVDDTTEPANGEAHLAALTAGNRVPWAKARKAYFSHGVNKASLSAIEKSSFVLSLDDEAQDYNVADQSALDKFARSMLHGKCCDRWFDKSFTLIVCSNGRVGFNAEHSWADAPIMSQMWEYVFHFDFCGGGGADAPMLAQMWESYIYQDLEHLGGDAPTFGVVAEYANCLELFELKYQEDGHCKGEVSSRLLNPIRLQWDLPSECIDVIESSLAVAQTIAEDVDLHIEVHRNFGKGIIKKCKMSPDAFIQLALQLAYFRDAGKFCLTYEASMTRLFREGRTETVRSCTDESSAFCRAVVEEKPRDELKRLLDLACERHQNGYRDAMTGLGIDRHLFCLYVVSKYLGVESPFLHEVLSEPWLLSSSQTPHSQMNLIDLDKYPDHVCAGGGFGPVSDNGYGVSYIIAGEETIFFHVSSKISCPRTSSMKFSEQIVQAMADVRRICGQ